MGITYRYREFHNVIADDSGEHGKKVFFICLLCAADDNFKFCRFF